MHTHCVEVLNRAHDDAIVGAVAHHFHLEFFPAEHGLLEENFGGRRQFETVGNDPGEFFKVIGNTAAAAAHRERRSDNGRESDANLFVERFIQCMSDFRPRRFQADFGHGLTKLLAVFGHVDRVA